MEGPEGSLDSLESPLRVVVDPAFFRWPLLLAGSTSTFARNSRYLSSQGLLKGPDLRDDHGHVQGVSIESSVLMRGVKMIEHELGGESSCILELGVLGVTIQVRTGDLNACNKLHYITIHKPVLHYRVKILHLCWFETPPCWENIFLTEILLSGVVRPSRIHSKHIVKSLCLITS